MAVPDIYSLVGEKILVTGGGGFIGTNVIKRLLNENVYIRATCHMRQPKFAFKEVEYVYVDLTNKEDCLKVTKGMDCIIMCAAFVSGAQDILSSPMKFVTDTVILNLRVLEAAYLNGVKKCIYISSGMVYPFKTHPLVENEGFLEDPYKIYFTGGWSRRFIEVVCRMYAEKMKAMDITALRIDNIYGPYDNFEKKKSHVMPALIRKTVERMDPLEVWGNGMDYKDFIFVEDLAEGIVLSLKKLTGYHVLNIASGKNITINDVLKIILRCGNYENARVVYNEKMPATIPFKVLSVEKAKEILGFVTKTSLEEGIKKTMNWYIENQVND